MGDPLSVAASVVGLLSLGLETTEYLYRYYKVLRDRDQDLARTADRLGDLLQSLQTVHETVQKRQWHQDDRTVLHNVEQSISRCEEIIHELETEVQKFSRESAGHSETASSATRRRMIYPLRRSTLEKLGEEVDDFRDNLSLALQALQLNDLRSTQNDMKEIKDIITNAQSQYLAASVRQWLKAPDATVDLNSACSKRYGRTGAWFIQSVTFTEWLQQRNSFLWLHGFAGCGKSVLCSTAVQHAFRHQRRQGDSAVAFFFFKFDDTSKRDSSAALRALLLQLCGQVVGLEADLEQLQNSSNDGTPPTATLTEYLRQAITKCRHVYILLDALDESTEGHTRDDVLSMIGTIRAWHLPGLHLLVTSRDIPDIRDHLSAHKNAPNTAFVPLGNGGLDKDIREYVSYKVDNDIQLRRWGSNCGRIKDHLTQHAGGVFRWVECQLQPLRQLPRSKRHLDHCLRTLPQSLDDTYERLLCNIIAESRDEARQILSLLCYSPRPLFVNEVIDALAVDVDGQQRYDPDRKLEGAEDLLRICPGLIEIVYPDTIFRMDERQDEDKARKIMNRRLVRIAHFSVQEYLVSDRIRQSSAAIYALSELTEASRISKLCLIHLLNEGFVTQELTLQLHQQYPFARFAARYWHHFYKQNGSQIEELSNMVEALLTQKRALDHWVRLSNPDRSLRIEFGASPSTAYRTPLYYAALLGLEGIVAKLILEIRFDINAGAGTFSYPLWAASANGHEKVVQVLLDYGSDIDAPGEIYDFSLVVASFKGHEKTVQTLLERGADVDAKDSRFGTSLQMASAGGQEKVVQVLLDCGADVNAGGPFGSALKRASSEGHERVVQILLDHGADINAHGDLKNSPLYHAKARGHEKIVQILLQAGAKQDHEDS